MTNYLYFNRGVFLLSQMSKTRFIEEGPTFGITESLAFINACKLALYSVINVEESTSRLFGVDVCNTEIGNHDVAAAKLSCTMEAEFNTYELLYDLE